MGGHRRLFLLWATVYAVATLATVTVRGYVFAKPGFTAISNIPEIGRHKELYIYAISRNADETPNVIEFTKDWGLPSNVVKTGTLVPFTFLYGCYLQVKEPNRQRGLRYGRYEATWIEGDPPGLNFTRETFVKPPSKVLDTRGVYTVTIYPTGLGETSLPESVPIGVKWSPGCYKIIWSKGKKQARVNTGPRLTLTSTEDAGLYTIQRPGRGRRGWSVQIRVIAASCPRGEYLDVASSGVCQSGRDCKNGAVLKDKENVCICPTFFGDLSCDFIVDTFDGDHFVVAQQTSSDALRCRDLPGGNPKCRGLLFCPGDNFGCKCSSGWWGNACDRPCPKGKYGPNCEESCPPEERDCSRFFGAY